MKEKNEIHGMATGVVITIKGRVRGVFYRAFVKRAVERHFRIEGYVRNLEDGSVEIFATGEKSEIERFINFLKSHKPVLAKVESISVRKSSRSWDHGFEIVI